MKKYAVIVAGGAGLRMGSPVPKQFLGLMGRPVLWYTLNSFLAAFNDLQIILVLPSAHRKTGSAILQDCTDPSRITVCEGGETRYQSVKNGLAFISGESIVFVHDAVRCLVTTELIQRCYDAALQFGNAIPAIPAVDSVRIQTENGNSTIDRKQVRLIQTPQTFLSKLLLPAFEQPYEEGFTDEATVVEKTGTKIHLVEGDAGNIKITTPIDILIAEEILKSREAKH